MQTDIIYASHYDTVASIKDKIKNHQSARICLVLPTRLLLFNAAQLNILRRYCADLGLELALVTREFQTLQYASQLNIQQYASIRRARKSSWYLYDQDERREDSLKQAPTKKDLNSLKLKAQQANQPPKISKLTRRVLIASVFIAIILLLAYLIPSATVFLTPEKKLQQMEIPLFDEQGNNLLTNILPIHTTTLSLNSQAEISTTGEISIPHTTATGSIQFTNITNAAVEIPAGTTLYAVIDEQQILVETERSVSLPAEVDSIITTSIIASNPGQQGNLPANSITNLVGDLSFYVTALNPTAMTGGSDQTTQAPSKDDYTQLRAQLTEDIQQQAQEKFTQNSAEGIQIINLSLQNTQEEFSPPSAQSAANTLALDIQTEVQIEYITEQDLINTFNFALDAQLLSGQTPLENSFSYEKLTENQQTYYLGHRLVIQEIDTQILLQKITGKTKSQALNILTAEVGEDASPQILFKPNFLNNIPFYRLPLLDLRIYFEMR